MTSTSIQPYLNLQAKVDIESFCAKWIPKLYGIRPDERGFKKFCVIELVKVMGGTVSNGNITKHWVWKDQQAKYPAIIDCLLTEVNARYSTIEINCGLDWLRAIHKEEREAQKGKKKRTSPTRVLPQEAA